MSISKRQIQACSVFYRSPLLRRLNKTGSGRGGLQPQRGPPDFPGRSHLRQSQDPEILELLHLSQSSPPTDDEKDSLFEGALEITVLVESAPSKQDPGSDSCNQEAGNPEDEEISTAAAQEATDTWEVSGILHRWRSSAQLRMPKLHPLHGGVGRALITVRHKNLTRRSGVKSKVGAQAEVLQTSR